MPNNEPSGGIGALLPSFSRIIAFDLPAEKYTELFSSRVDKLMVLPGRGLTNDTKGIYEFQAFMVLDEPAVTEALMSSSNMTNGALRSFEGDQKRYFFQRNTSMRLMHFFVPKQHAASYRYYKGKMRPL